MPWLDHRCIIGPEALPAYHHERGSVCMNGSAKAIENDLGPGI